MGCMPTTYQVIGARSYGFGLATEVNRWFRAPRGLRLGRARTAPRARATPWVGGGSALGRPGGGTAPHAGGGGLFFCLCVFPADYFCATGCATRNSGDFFLSLSLQYLHFTIGAALVAYSRRQTVCKPKTLVLHFDVYFSLAAVGIEPRTLGFVDRCSTPRPCVHLQYFFLSCHLGFSSCYLGNETVSAKSDDKWGKNHRHPRMKQLVYTKQNLMNDVCG